MKSKVKGGRQKGYGSGSAFMTVSDSFSSMPKGINLKHSSFLQKHCEIISKNISERHSSATLCRTPNQKRTHTLMNRLHTIHPSTANALASNTTHHNSTEPQASSTIDLFTAKSSASNTTHHNSTEPQTKPKTHNYPKHPQTDPPLPIASPRDKNPNKLKGTD